MTRKVRGKIVVGNWNYTFTGKEEQFVKSDCFVCRLQKSVVAKLLGGYKVVKLERLFYFQNTGYSGLLYKGW